jgi:hypothetical protein
VAELGRAGVRPCRRLPELSGTGGAGLKIDRTSVVAACCAALVACGGSDDPGPAASVAGLYEGSGGGNRASEFLILDDGRYYLVYGLTSASAAPVGGVIVGDGSTSGSAFASTNAHDFNLLSRTLLTGTLNSTLLPKASAATMLVRSDATTASYGGTFNAGSDADASPSALIGTYGGEFAGLGGTDASLLSVDAVGVIAGTTSGTCTYFGLALPRSRGNVYDLSLTLRTGCANPGSTLHGHAFLSGKTLFAIAVSGDLASVALFAGVKP